MITAAYNAELFIAETIQSVLNQTFNDWEHIVVNDGSTDSTAHIIRSFPKVTYIDQPNRGVAAARNTAIQYASGKLLAFLDADDIWLPDKLALQVNEFQANPDLGLCYTNASHINEEGNVILFCRIPPHPPTTYFSALTKGHNIVTSSLMVDRQYLDNNPFCEDLPPCEDFYLSLLVLYQSGYGVFIDKPLVRYRVRSNSISRSDRFYWMSQNEKAVVRFLDKADSIKPLPVHLRSRAMGHLAYQRAGINIERGRDVHSSIKLLIKAARLNPSDSWPAIRQFAKLVFTMNSRLKFFIHKT